MGHGAQNRLAGQTARQSNRISPGGKGLRLFFCAHRRFRAKKRSEFAGAPRFGDGSAVKNPLCDRRSDHRRRVFGRLAASAAAASGDKGGFGYCGRRGRRPQYAFAVALLPAGNTRNLRGYVLASLRAYAALFFGKCRCSRRCLRMRRSDRRMHELQLCCNIENIANRKI